MDSVRQSKALKIASTQSYLKIAEIKEGIVVLKDGSVRKVLKTNSLNFYLQTEGEQQAIVSSYQSFLNSLDHPIQILIRSQRMNVDDYLAKLVDRADTQSNELLARQTRDYIDYISYLVDYADIMNKDFYVVVPYDPDRNVRQNFFSKFLESITPHDTISKLRTRAAEFDKMKKGVSSRATQIKSGLEMLGLNVVELGTEHLIELFYECYNPISARSERLGNLAELNLEDLPKQ
jgi:type IV secretory pathway VirB4 component